MARCGERYNSQDKWLKVHLIDLLGGYMKNKEAISMDYLELLEHSYKTNNIYTGEMSRLNYLSENIFDFTTYDSGIGELFGKKAVEVCEAINNKQTFEYHDQPDGYMWFLIMVNMPFFTNKLEWGTSIRGAWWSLYGDKTFTLNSCGLWKDDDQLLDLELNAEQWELFIKAVSDFANKEA